MRQVFLFMMVSLDGYYEGPDHDISWHNVDAEFNRFAIKQTGEVGTLLFGRKTYALMAGYWPTEMAKGDDPVVASQMNSLAKVVFSKSLEEVEWENSSLVKEDAAEFVRKLKQSEGKDIAIFGSSDLMLTLIPHGVIDEYRIFVNPVVLGSGKRLFGPSGRLNLRLAQAAPMKSGVTALVYEATGQ